MRLSYFQQLMVLVNQVEYIDVVSPLLATKSTSKYRSLASSEKCLNVSLASFIKNFIALSSCNSSIWLRRYTLHSCVLTIGIFGMVRFTEYRIISASCKANCRQRSASLFENPFDPKIALDRFLLIGTLINSMSSSFPSVEDCSLV